MMRITSLVLLLLRYCSFTSSDSTSTSGGDKTDLSTSRCVSSNGRSVTNMLMVTSSVRMLNWIHSNTTNLGPAVTLSLVLVIGTSGLEDWLLGTTTTGDDTNHGSVLRLDCLLGARWELYLGLLCVWIVGDNCGVTTRGTSQLSSITRLLLDVTD